MSLVHLVHISDLHAQEQYRLDIMLRTKALLADLADLKVKPDRVLFTGDMAFSGKPEEYALAQMLLLDPLRKQLHLEPSQIIVIPGNHDADRSFIDPIREIGLVNHLSDAIRAEAIMEDPTNGQARLKGYSDYMQSYFGLGPAVYRTHIVDTPEGAVGFACLNSAWRCSGDEDKGQLFLTRNQVLPAALSLTECIYKFALVHHPLTWLHSSEQTETIPDLMREFDVILRGHLHASYSVKAQNAVTECLELACPALCDGRLPGVGYNLYTLDLENGKLTARFRCYSRTGNYFDLDTATAKGGQAVFQLPPRTPRFSELQRPPSFVPHAPHAESDNRLSGQSDGNEIEILDSFDVDDYNGQQEPPVTRPETPVTAQPETPSVPKEPDRGGVRPELRPQWKHIVTIGAGFALVALFLIWRVFNPTITDRVSGRGPLPTLSQLDFETVKYDSHGIQTARSKEWTNYFSENVEGVPIDMVEIRGGSFHMGSKKEALSDPDEEPQHPVTVPTFYMGRFKITRRQWQQVAQLPKETIALREDPSNFKDSWEQPVEQVSWEEAVEFCDRLKNRTGRAYRLPTEAEWEYAARAGTSTPFAFGETITSDIVNYNGKHPYGSQPVGDYRGKTTVVGSLGVANAFGLSDMHGNVWEWCADVWHKNYIGAPSNGTAWINGDEKDKRVLRGGSRDSYGRNARSAFRFNYGYKDHSLNNGFRVVFSP